MFEKLKKWISEIFYEQVDPTPESDTTFTGWVKDEFDPRDQQYGAQNVEH